MLRLILKSFLCGFVITVICVGVVLLTGNKTASKILLSPIALLMYGLGPPPLLGYDARGNPVYEGTPADIFIMILGVLLCIPFYSILSFIIFASLKRLKKNRFLK